MGKEVYRVEAYRGNSSHFFFIYGSDAGIGLMEEPELALPSLTTLLHAAPQGHNHYFLLPFLLFPPPPLPAE